LSLIRNSVGLLLNVDDCGLSLIRFGGQVDVQREYSPRPSTA
jgi:hypothetical protein